MVFVLAFVLITSAISGDDENNNSFGTLSGVQLEVAQALSDAGFGNVQIAAIMGNISGESSDWNPTSEYHGENGEYGFGLFQFTDAPSQGVYNYTDFANWCSANGKDKNTAGAPNRIPHKRAFLLLENRPPLLRLLLRRRAAI